MKRTVLVTGGARRIGASIVRALAAAGHAVAIHHFHSIDDAAALAETVRAGGGEAATFDADLSDAAAARALIGRAAATFGRPIDGLVNCASQFIFDGPTALDPALLHRLVDVNLAAPVLLAGALAEQPGLKHGAIVNFLDQKVANLNPDFFSYTCTKIALAGATEMLARALAPTVRVNAVAPGLTLPSGDQSDAEFEAVARENLLRRRVDIDEIDRAVVFLLETASVTGQTLFVDCGQRFVQREGDVMFENRER